MSVALKLKAHDKDLGGGFIVRRLLPAMARQAVGPFLFFDHFGPVEVVPEDNHDVRPHPHIGLATVTYLFSGAIMHRDSAGHEQRIEPGAINWMSAGRGIVHSERRPADLAASRYTNHGLQLWTALPQAHEEDAPSFTHTPADAIPEFARPGAQVRVLIGEAFGQRSPVAAYANTLYLDIQLQGGERFELPALAREMAVYPVDGEIRIDGEVVGDHTLALLEPGKTASLEADTPRRLVVIGGDPLDAPRFIWWNFVSSRKARIQQAAQDWQAQVMGQVAGETEFIPLPERAFKAD
ncbi:pirin family protein [Niveibacterium sp. SC-1]|uniref:pirin family protein n=1 Tax=Niveibacterium sp. SC-1 TaxID=3135646 RepID=UPI00311EFCC7